MGDGAERQRYAVKRERYLVNARLQWAIMLPLVATVAVVALAHASAIYLGGEALDTLSAEETRRLFLRSGLIYYGLSLALLAALAIFLTHRIAGPVLVIERAVRGLRRGEYEHRLELRPRDFLQLLAAAVSELRDDLREQDERRRSLIEEVASRLEAGDAAGARKLLAELCPSLEADDPIAIGTDG